MISLLLPLVLAAAPALSQAPSPLLDFSLTPEALGESCAAALKRAQERLDALAALPGSERNFSNTLLAFDFIQNDLEAESSGAIFLKYVSPQEKVREAGNSCETSVEKFAVDIYTREDLYLAMKAVPGSDLKGADARLKERTLMDFRRNGLELDARGRARYRLLKKQLVEMEAEFSKNLNEVRDFALFKAEELKGLPEDFTSRLEKNAEGLFKVTLDSPDYMPFMKNASNPESRRRLITLYGNRAVPQNLVLLDEILALRLRLAKELGYPTHAHYVLEERMAKTPEAVASFLDSIRTKLKAKGELELAAMLQLKRREEPGAQRIESWDYFYYIDKMKKDRYSVDDEKIKEYFPADKVASSVLAVYQELLGLKFKEEPTVGAWHDEVKLFSVSDARSGDLIGHFYMDLYPRDGKYKHFAAFSLIGGRREADGSYRRPVSAVVANFPRATKERPALFPHDSVETYFHEFGHIMHQVLTKAGHPRFAGTKVARDFVEAPSQMLENWIWDKAILKRVSGHYKTGKPLPDELLGKMLAAKNMDSGIRYLTQNFYATIDQSLHDAALEDSSAAYNELYEKIRLIPPPPGTHAQASFGHLMGYAASYYGYMWSEVFSSDMFSLFEKSGVMNEELGRRYRSEILETGGARDEGESLKAFLGRAPEDGAFLKSIGLD